MTAHRSEAFLKPEDAPQDQAPRNAISEMASRCLPGENPHVGSRPVTIEVPEKVLLAEKMDEGSFAREIRVLSAVKLYELGRLSSGRAAELAGMGRVEFLLELKRYRSFPLEAELSDLEARAGRDQ